MRGDADAIHSGEQPPPLPPLPPPPSPLFLLSNRLLSLRLPPSLCPLPPHHFLDLSPTPLNSHRDENAEHQRRTFLAQRLLLRLRHLVVGRALVRWQQLAAAARSSRSLAQRCAARGIRRSWAFGLTTWREVVVVRRVSAVMGERAARRRVARVLARRFFLWCALSISTWF